MFPLSLFTFLSFSSFAVVAFYLPLYFQFQGLTVTEVGTVMGVGSLTTIFSQPFWGYMSDKKKTIKRTLIFILSAGLLISIGLFSSHMFIAVFLFMILFTFFFSSAGPLIDSLIIKYTLEHQRHYGSIRLWGEAGVGVSAVLLGVLMQSYGMQYLGLMFAVLLAIALLSSSMVTDAKSKSVPVNLAALKELLQNRKFLWFLILVLLVGTTHKMNDGMLAIYLKSLGGSSSQIGTAWLFATLSSIPVMGFMGKVLNRFKSLHVFAVAALFYTIRWVIYSMANHPETLMVMQFLNGLSFPVFFISAVHYLSEIVPSHLRATGQTTFMAVFVGVGGIIGNALGGWSIDQYGAHLTYAVGSMLAFVGFIAVILTNIVYQKKQKESSCVH